MTTDPTFKVAISRYALDHKILPGDPFWHDFNGSFSNSEVTAYDLAGAIWNGHPLTTWHKDHWRSTANFVTGQHLGLDFDTEDERSTLATLTADKFIARHGAMCYTTPSHTDDKPKARAIFLLDTPIMQASNYALAAAALLWYYSAADRQCKDPARFFYGSKGCDFEMIDHVLPLETVKHMIQQYKETGQAARHKQMATWAGHTEQAEVADALRRIPAWSIEYDEWVGVLMALHREYGDAGLPLAVQWGDGADGEIERKWKSFNGKGNLTGAVGLGSVFLLAQRFGWTRNKTN